MAEVYETLHAKHGYHADVNLEPAPFPDPTPLCTAGRRMPSLIIPGFAKCGSTTLFEDVRRFFKVGHATKTAFWSGSPKEPTYWSFRSSVEAKDSLARYAVIWPSCASTNLTMDASPSYLGWANPNEMRLMLGVQRQAAMRVLVVANEPLQHAQSWYYHLTRLYACDLRVFANQPPCSKPWKSFREHVDDTLFGNVTVPNAMSCGGCTLDANVSSRSRRYPAQVASNASLCCVLP